MDVLIEVDQDAPRRELRRKGKRADQFSGDVYGQWHQPKSVAAHRGNSVEAGISHWNIELSHWETKCWRVVVL